MAAVGMEACRYIIERTREVGSPQVPCCTAASEMKMRTPLSLTQTFLHANLSLAQLQASVASEKEINLALTEELSL